MVLPIYLSKESRVSGNFVRFGLGLESRRWSIANRAERVLKNAGWFNLNGKQVMWGDVSEGNVELLLDKLPEPLVFLPEDLSDSSMRDLDPVDANRLLRSCQGLVLPETNDRIGEFYRFFVGNRGITRMHTDRKTRGISVGGELLIDRDDYTFPYYFAGRKFAWNILLNWYLPLKIAKMHRYFLEKGLVI